MAIFVLMVLIADAVLVSAGQYQGQGVNWADQICSITNGLCHQPLALGLQAGFLTSAYFLATFFNKRSRR
jgi:hypothetical protein